MEEVERYALATIFCLEACGVIQRIKAISGNTTATFVKWKACLCITVISKMTCPGTGDK